MTDPVTDPTTDDTVRAAFVALREHELARTVPPGVAAAHRTVRRRRAATRVGTGLTAVLLLGSGYLAATWGPDPRTSPAEAVPFSAGASPTQAAEDAGWMGLDPDEVGLSGIASAAVSTSNGGPVFVTVFDVPADHVNTEGEPAPTRSATGRPPADTPYPVMTANQVHQGADQVRPGHHEVRVACAGPASSLDLTIQVGEHRASVTVECGPTAEAAYAGRAVTSLGELTTDHFAAGLEVTVWRGELTGPQPLAIAFALVPES